MAISCRTMYVERNQQVWASSIPKNNIGPEIDDMAPSVPCNVFANYNDILLQRVTPNHRWG
jgi:hypothetical protein